MKFFNALFDEGIFPDSWTESMALFKKGDVDKPSNYRGISLCDTSSIVRLLIIDH